LGEEVLKENNKLLFGAVVGAAALTTLYFLKKRINRYDFRDKVVLITGGSRGLGLVLARTFAGEGAKLAICARDSEELANAQRDLQLNYGAEVIDIVCDVTNDKQVHQMIDLIKKEYGQIDVLVNNAGVIQVGSLAVQTRKDFADSLAVHFWGAYNTIQAVLPIMRQQGEGRIVNISSIGGKVAVPHLAPYCAGKFALVGLSNALRVELARENIIVTTVCPGLMRTGSHVNALFKGQHEIEFALFSIMNALPITSTSAEKAAHEIIEACRQGKAEKIISFQAKLAAKANVLFPEFIAEMMEFVNQFLPVEGGIGKNYALGKDSTSFISPSFLTSQLDNASIENNELKPNEQN
jgi:short-subunit dehydrogenase